ncbi:MAG TPA: class I SAM-dependent methyltransferase, partial [Longimicrobiales bacterium]|nr:class I SAM-dependent methyltransferase [Longimicrobiales bacterium]
MAEAGVFAGGTARLICEAKGDAPLHLFDVFETLQPGRAAKAMSPEAREVQSYFRSFHTPRHEVENLLRAYPEVHVHAGVFPGSTEGLEADAFSFVHVDLDLEDGTRRALEFFHPRLLEGGILLGDDYNDTGVRRAFDGYFAGRTERVVELPWGQALVVKV